MLPENCWALLGLFATSMRRGRSDDEVMQSQSSFGQNEQSVTSRHTNEAGC